jgi:radical SAM-linked protein
MRYFQKVFRRAEIDVVYSQGFNPHQLMSFAAPLGVGLTSDGEYMDVQLNSCESPEIMINRINTVMEEDIQVVNFLILPEDSKNAMSIVAAADYLVSVKDDYEFMDKSSFELLFLEFYNQQNIIINKKTKKSENEIDIKPFIYYTAFNREDFYQKIGPNCIANTYQSLAQEYQNGIKIYMQLATGSVNNLKPELVMEAFSRYAGMEFNPYAYQVHRMEVYADLGDEKARKLTALDKL